MSPVAVQYAVPRAGLPAPASLRRYAAAALATAGGPTGDVTVRLADEAEVADLNRRYRARRGPTNVLAFPLDAPGGAGARLLGDVVICAPVALAEARARGTAPRAHFAHLVVHGVLHLLGHDHHRPAEAARMEALERRVLAGLGFPDPYAQPHEPAAVAAVRAGGRA